MNRSDLCKHLAANTSLTNADAAAALDAVISTIADALAAGETVTIAGFGKFSTKDRAARHGRNPAPGRPLPSPPLGCLPSRPESPFAMRSTASVLTQPVERAAPATARTLRQWNHFTIATQRRPRVAAPPQPRRLRHGEQLAHSHPDALVRDVGDRGLPSCGRYGAQRTRGDFGDPSHARTPAPYIPNHVCCQHETTGIPGFVTHAQTCAVTRGA